MEGACAGTFLEGGGGGGGARRGAAGAGRLVDIGLENEDLPPPLERDPRGILYVFVRLSYSSGVFLSLVSQFCCVLFPL